jgi:hypothetical protein
MSTLLMLDFLALQTARKVGLSLRGMYKVLACVFFCIRAV